MTKLMEVVPMLDITLQQIVAFLTVAEYLSFTEAAKVMYISQPALSKIISRLERVSALTLFVRKSHGVELTREGEYLRGELDPLYNKILKAFKDAQLMSSPPKKLLHIASHTSSYTAESLHGEYRRLIDEYKNKYPAVAVVEELFEFKELRNALLTGQADLIHTTDFVVDELKEISYKKLEKMNFYIVMSGAHPLASSETLPLEKLGNETFYFVSPSYTEHTEFERCVQIGFTPKQILHLPNFPSVIHAVRQGKGMALLTFSDEDSLDKDLKFFLAPPLPDPPYMVIAWRTNDVPKEAVDFIDLIPTI